MNFDAEELAAATAAQQAAATDPSDHVRVIAGPGTGKSQTIEQRVVWLLSKGVHPARIVAVSFTRAAADDLSSRVNGAIRDAGLEGQVRVGTLHSFALRALRLANLLNAYPSEPKVLQAWEVDNIFDAEFGHFAGVGSLPRRREIRADHEAFWQTGHFDPPQASLPDPPISADERQRFETFHGPRTQLYSCVLPGEIVRLCVDQVRAGTLDPVAVLEVDHLIVDEFQDLNPMDLELVHELADNGVKIFAAGDDDQSLYAFRHATPAGIQAFTSRRQNVGDHALSHCFRCTPAVLAGAQSLIGRNSDAGRIPKHLTSMYAEASPSIPGWLIGSRYPSDRKEAKAIAASCSELITAGFPPHEIMILLAGTRAGLPITKALAEAGVPFAPPREEDITDTPAGRAAYAALSIAVDPENYIAHRTLLGIQKGVGIKTCDDIARTVIQNHKNFRDLFYGPQAKTLLSGRALTAVESTAAAAQTLGGWSKADFLEDRIDDLCALVDDTQAASSGEVATLRAFLGAMPKGFGLEDALAYLGATRDDDRRDILRAFSARTDIEVDLQELVPERVRVMTMHSAKGLSAQIVFIPALEEELLPGARRAKYPGQVLEAARMFYVSITRARLACIVSYSAQRFEFGSMASHSPSRYAKDLGIKFKSQTGGLTPESAAGLHRAAAEL